MKKKRPAISIESDQDLEKQALVQLNAGKFKEAITLYKKLLKSSDNEQWHQQLAYCYVQRASSFAAKGMLKEALVLWENQRQHVQPPYFAYDQYIVWLILSKDKASIQANISQLSTRQLDKEYPALASVLGLLTLTEYPEFEQDLPQDSVFIAHLKLMQAALKAYQDNHLDMLHEILQQVPYRSAFRGLRTVLNALIAIPDSLEKGQLLLAKVPAHSAYALIARLLLASTKNGAELAGEMVQFNHQQRSIIGAIKGLNNKQLEFIEYLARQHGHLSNKVKFNMAIQYKSLCGSELAKNFCQILLASDSAGHKDFKKSFGEVDEFEENRLKALICERDDNRYDAAYYWRLCIRELISRGTDNGLKIALILRHIAERERHIEDKIELLIESLEHDADDRESYLQILGYYEHEQQAESVKEYKQWLTKTIDKFPQDIDVLIKAVQAAIRNKAYKKASQYAAKILNIDPLNTFAKQTLFSSHLAHARRLMQGKKYHLVESEIQQAEKLNLGKECALKTQLMRGFFAFVDQDKQQALQSIVETLSVLHSDPVNAYFHATIEALLTGLPVATILRELSPAKEHLLSVAELTQLIQLLKDYSAESNRQEQIHKALEKIKSALKRSLSGQVYPESLLLSFCQIMDALNHFELLRHCARLALAQWKKPIWVYYKVYAELNGRPEDCTYQHIFALQSNHEIAIKEKDYRTEMLIRTFIDRYYEAHPQRGMGFLESLFGMDDEDEEELDELDMLFGQLPDGVLIKINDMVGSFSQTTSPEQLINELMKTVGNNEPILLAMMQNPDLFSALLILRAADKLGIDIGVSLDDVLECFEVGKKTSRFPFPF